MLAIPVWWRIDGSRKPWVRAMMAAAAVPSDRDHEPTFSASLEFRGREVGPLVSSDEWETTMLAARNANVRQRLFAFHRPKGLKRPDLFVALLDGATETFQDSLLNLFAYVYDLPDKRLDRAPGSNSNAATRPGLIEYWKSRFGTSARS